MFLWVDLDCFLSLLLCMTHCGLLQGSTSFHRTTVLGRYLSTICLWILRGVLLYMVCAQLRCINTLVSLGSNKDSTNYVLSPELLVYKRVLSNHLQLYLSKFEPSISSELRLHYHLDRACCALSTISIVWTLPPVSSVQIVPALVPAFPDCSRSACTSQQYIFTACTC